MASAGYLEIGAPAAIVKAVHPTHVLHLAWCASPRDYLTNPENSRWAAATAELGEAFISAGGERFVGAGSCAEYTVNSPSLDGGDSRRRPASLYARAKAEAFERLSELADRSDLSLAWARIFFPYGPYQSPERLISSVIMALERGDPFDCRSGEQLRDFIHVHDLARALGAILESDIRGALDIGSGGGAAVRDVVTALERIVGRRSWICFGARPQAIDEPAAAVADTRRLRRELGWHPRIGLEEGLTATVAWWRGAREA
jgi:nucleoside-diphosphate-sugar epimerase